MRPAKEILFAILLPKFIFPAPAAPPCSPGSQVTPTANALRVRASGREVARSLPSREPAAAPDGGQRASARAAPLTSRLEEGNQAERCPTSSGRSCDDPFALHVGAVRTQRALLAGGTAEESGGTDDEGGIDARVPGGREARPGGEARPRLSAGQVSSDAARGRLRHRLVRGRLQHRLVRPCRRDPTDVFFWASVSAFLALGGAKSRF